jgi:hypothetical protein|tara:strand:- start:238 stop:405 length:168 start_codon:yes stop_codon:yes gene_type:complete
MNEFADIIDNLFKDLINLKKMHRTKGISSSFQSAAKTEINKHLAEIDIETSIPKS